MYQVDWESGIITIPKADLTYLSVGKYKLDLYLFMLECMRLNWEDGLSYPEIITYYPSVDTGDVILGKTILINYLDYTVIFENGQYAVLFDGANTNIHNYTIVNQVSIRPNNSAGLQDLSTLLAMAYTGKVVLDETNGQSGTATPIGTLGLPSNNMTDALTIANNNGIGVIEIVGTYTIVDDVSDLTIKGRNSVLSDITVADVAITLNTTFEDCTINGILDGNSTIINCSIETLSYVDGYIYQSVLNESVITLGNETQALFLDCWSGVAGANTPTIDMGGSGQALAMRGYAGGLKITNRTGTDPVSIDFNSGQFIGDTSIVNGTIYVRGTVGKITDNSTPPAVVDIEGVTNPRTVAQATWDFVI